MVTALLVIHILVCLSLIFIVLIQGGKGAQMGAAFGGGSSQTVFGSRGASTFLGKMTTVVAVVFMVTSLLLAMASVRTGSVVKQAPAPAAGPTVPSGQGGALPVPPTGGSGSPLPPVEGQPSPVPPAPPASGQ